MNYLTATHLSTNLQTDANELTPTVGTAKPSANVDSLLVYVGLLLAIAFLKLAHFSDSAD